MSCDCAFSHDVAACDQDTLNDGTRDRLIAQSSQKVLPVLGVEGIEGMAYGALVAAYSRSAANLSQQRAHQDSITAIAASTPDTGEGVCACICEMPSLTEAATFALVWIAASFTVARDLL